MMARYDMVTRNSGLPSFLQHSQPNIPEIWGANAGPVHCWHTNTLQASTLHPAGAYPAAGPCRNSGTFRKS